MVAGAAPRLQIWCGSVRAGPGGFDSHAPPPRRINLLQTIKVVIANRHRLYRECIKRVLELEMDISVVGEICRAEEMRDVISSLRPDVIVYDDEFLDKGSIGPIPELSKEFAPFRCVLLTSKENNYHDRLQNLRKSGIYECILKSSKAEDLLSAIRNVAKADPYNDPRLETYKKPVSLIEKDTAQLDHLTPREREVLYWLSQGFSNQNIAQIMFLSEKTVKNHVSRILKKLDFSDRTQAAVFAWKAGLAQYSPDQFYEILGKTQ